MNILKNIPRILSQSVSLFSLDFQEFAHYYFLSDIVAFITGSIIHDGTIGE